VIRSHRALSAFAAVLCVCSTGGEGSRRGFATAQEPAGATTASRGASVEPPAAAPSAPSAPSAAVLVNSIGMRFVAIAPGKFLMGSKNEFGRWAYEHQHEVAITKGFLLGAYEVTQAEYEKVIGKHPSAFAPGGAKAAKVEGIDTARCPVDSVTWPEAVEYCRRLGELDAEKAAGRTYRLPAEAEWEYACRAGATTPFHYGESLSSKQANFDGTTPYLAREDVIQGVDPKTLAGPFLQRTAPVGSYEPNAWGLYDMHGNVREWCADWFSPVYYKSSPIADPQGPEAGTKRVARGGGYYYFAAGCRAASRYETDPELRRDNYGLRVVCDVVAEPAGEKPAGEKPAGEKPAGEKPAGE